MEMSRCEECCCTLKSKQSYENHIKTNRHRLKCQIHNGEIVTTNSHTCTKCNKTFAFKSGLCRHKKTCTSVPPVDPTMATMMTQVMKKLDKVEETNEKLIETNEKLQATIASMKMQMVPFSGGQTNNITNNITNNNHITVQDLKIYLNTECKDAKTIMDFIENLNLTCTERCELELTNYNTTVSKIWKRNYLALPEKERPLYCVPTAESKCTVFAKGEEAWQEQNDTEFMTKLEIKPKNMNDIMLATTAVNETCNKIYNLYEEAEGDEKISAQLKPKAKGSEREEWLERKAHIWRDACKLDAELRGSV